MTVNKDGKIQNKNFETCTQMTSFEPSNSKDRDQHWTGWWLRCKAEQSGLGSEWFQEQGLHCPIEQ